MKNKNHLQSLKVLTILFLLTILESPSFSEDNSTKDDSAILKEAIQKSTRSVPMGRMVLSFAKEEGGEFLQRGQETVTLNSRVPRTLGEVLVLP